MNLIFQYAAFGENIPPFLRQVSCLRHISKSTTTSFTISASLLMHHVSPQKTNIIDKCDCPCDDLVEVETPPGSVMVLAYIAQAVVVTIVGFNMGFRYVRHCMQWTFSIAHVLRLIFRQNYCGIWKKILLPKKYERNVAAKIPSVFLPHHGPNSGLAKTKKASEREMNCHSSSSPFVLPHYTHE